MSRKAYIGLGSNLGDPVANIERALDALAAAPGVTVAAVSRAYESEPWGVTDQPAFANAVARVSFDGEADELLGMLQEIESEMGRRPGPPNGPRVIDLDILLFGDEEWDAPDLRIPHPRMHRRDFVVTPLLEIAPGTTLPDGTALSRGGAVDGRVTRDLGAVPGWAPDEVWTSGAEAAAADAGDARATVRPTHEETLGEWVAVGDPQTEFGAPNSLTKLDLVYFEAELLAQGIPCTWDPHRPNEGFYQVPAVQGAVRLLVPADRAVEAREIVEELRRGFSAAPVADGPGEPWASDNARFDSGPDRLDPR